jgi:hypothetical protein
MIHAITFCWACTVATIAYADGALVCRDAIGPCHIERYADSAAVERKPEVMMIRAGRTIAIMPSDTDLHHVDSSEGFIRLRPGSCIAAPPAKCLMPTDEDSPHFETKEP